MAELDRGAVSNGCICPAAQCLRKQVTVKVHGRSREGLSSKFTSKGERLPGRRFGGGGAAYRQGKGLGPLGDIVTLHRHSILPRRMFNGHPHQIVDAVKFLRWIATKKVTRQRPPVRLQPPSHCLGPPGYVLPNRHRL